MVDLDLKAHHGALNLYGFLSLVEHIFLSEGDILRKVHAALFSIVKANGNQRLSSSKK